MANSVKLAPWVLARIGELDKTLDELDAALAAGEVSPVVQAEVDDGVATVAAALRLFKERVERAQAELFAEAK